MKTKLKYLLSSLFVISLVNAEEVPPVKVEEPKKDLQEAEKEAPKESLEDQTLLVCQMKQRKEDNGGVVNGLPLGTLEIVSRPSQKEFPFELRYKISSEAGKELDLIDEDYFPMTLMAFKSTDLAIKEVEEANPEVDAENLQKRQIRYFLDFLQVVGGLYSNVDVYGYHVFNDAKELGVNVVYFTKDMSILAVAGQYYGNYYTCLPKAPEGTPESASKGAGSLPETKIQWKSLHSRRLSEKLKAFSIRK